MGRELAGDVGSKLSAATADITGMSLRYSGWYAKIIAICLIFILTSCWSETKPYRFLRSRLKAMSSGAIS